MYIYIYILLDDKTHCLLAVSLFFLISDYIQCTGATSEAMMKAQDILNTQYMCASNYS